MKQMNTIAIVGAGPAGLTAAIAAAQSGIPAVIYEHSSHLPQIGAGFLIHSNGLRVLDSLQLLERFLPDINLTQNMKTELNSGETITHFDYSSMSIPHNHGAVILREHLRGKLFEAAIEAGVTFKFGHTCVNLEINAQGCRLEFANGSEAQHSVVLACDGVNSKIRQLSGVRAKIVPADYVTFAGISTNGTDQHCTHEIWSKDGGYFGICPLPGNRSFFYSRGADINDDSDRANQTWAQRWSKDNAVVAKVLEGTDLNALVKTQFREVWLEKWHKGPIFFLGDAAHAMKPNLGQGANSSMVDALVLTRLIAENIQDDFDAESVGKTYQKIRKPYVSKLQLLSRMIDTARGTDNKIFCSARNSILQTSQLLKWPNNFVMNLVAGYNPQENEWFSSQTKQKHTTFFRHQTSISSA